MEQDRTNRVPAPAAGATPGGSTMQVRRIPARRVITRWLAIVVALLVATAAAAAPSVRAEADLAPLLTALADAYAAGIVVVDDAADLVLERGSLDWRSEDTVAVTSDAVLRMLVDTAEAQAFLRFAVSVDGQRALVGAGFLPSSVAIEDQDGRSFDLAQPVERIFSPYGLATYMVYALGAADRLVNANYLGARDPEGAAAMTRIDPRFREIGVDAPEDTTNAEFVATLTPDLVLASTDSDWVVPVEAIGIPVIGFEGESLERMRDAMRILGAALGPDAAARADAWIAYYDDVLAKVERATAGATERPRVLFTGTERTRVASGAMYQSAVIEAAGGTSVTAHLGGGWNDVDIEQVLVWDPELVLVPPYGRASVEAIVEDPEWQLLEAVRSGNVLRVPKLVAPWDTPVPDSVLAVVWLAEVLHGDLTGLDCAGETTYFYRRFYDYDITPDEVTALCGR